MENRNFAIVAKDETLLVLLNLFAAVILVILRFFSQVDVLAWDIATIVISVISLFISQSIIRYSFGFENGKATKIVAVAMASFAGLMIATSLMTIII